MNVMLNFPGHAPQITRPVSLCCTRVVNKTHPYLLNISGRFGQFLLKDLESFREEGLFFLSSLLLKEILTSIQLGFCQVILHPTNLRGYSMASHQQSLNINAKQTVQYGACNVRKLFDPLAPVLSLFHCCFHPLWLKLASLILRF